MIGGITYRLFEDRNFVEIVFCTVATDEQIHVESNGSIQSQAFGTRLMNHVKEYLKNRVGFMLTYADENAKGFFKKQGFSETILIESKLWKGYIKDYDNATLRCCQLFPQVDYHDVRTMVGRQREAVYKIIAARSHHATVYHLPEGEITDPLAIPGVKEAGWDQASLTEPTKSSNGLQERLSRLLTEVWEHSDSWAFRQPVNTDTVVDYLSIIKKPMGRNGYSI